MKKLLIIFSLLLILVNIFIANAEEDKLQRFNNLSIYQHTETHNTKISLFTLITKGTWFAQNVFDTFLDTDYNYTNYYTISTLGKYLNKKMSVRVQIEDGNTFETNYYAGVGIDF